jgi:hypothetical protein
MYGIFFRDGNKYVLSIGENDLFKVNIRLTNIGEPAYEPSFYLVVPKDMQYAGSRPIYPVSENSISLIFLCKQ